MNRLKGQIAVVTGAYQGIGKAISLAFAEEGASVILVDQQPTPVAEGLVKEIKDLGVRAMAVQADITKRPEVIRFIETGLSEFGQIDILVNNAGVTSVGPFETLPEEAWDHVIEVNLKGVFLCCQEVGRHMIGRGKGNIINMSSLLGMVVLPGRAAYCASKAAVSTLTKVLAVEWAKNHVRVNAIAPVTTRTEFMEKLIAQGTLSLENLVKNIPAGRVAEPRDIALTAVFLASEESSLITGQTLIVDGGYSAL